MHCIPIPSIMHWCTAPTLYFHNIFGLSSNSRWLYALSINSMQRLVRPPPRIGMEPGPPFYLHGESSGLHAFPTLLMSRPFDIYESTRYRTYILHMRYIYLYSKFHGHRLASIFLITTINNSPKTCGRTKVEQSRLLFPTYTVLYLCWLPAILSIAGDEKLLLKTILQIEN